MVNLKSLSLDETCLSLVRLGVLDPLIGLIKREGIRLREVTEDKFLSKVVHGGLGTLKNLSLAPGTRVEMGSKDVIGVLVDLFNVELIKPFHVTIISTIKNLCMGANDGNVYRVLTGLEPGKSDLKGLPIPSALTKSPLAKIVKVIWNSSKELDSGVKSEGGRLIVNIVKAIHKSNGSHHLTLS